MNIEDLTKTQLLLLTILVNFVTSIATGVLTVSLLDQAPPTVIQTVNRIVDHTIETVTTEVPVIRNVPSAVPSSEDLLTSAIAEGAARTVRIYRSGTEEPVGHGVYIASARAVVTSGNLPGKITVEFATGARFEANEAEGEGEVRRYAFAPEAGLPSAPAGRLVSFAELKQGQTVIGLSGSGGAVTGIIARIDDYLHTDLPEIPLGAAGVNLSGDIVGISLGDGRFVLADRVSALLAP